MKYLFSLFCFVAFLWGLNAFFSTYDLNNLQAHAAAQNDGFKVVELYTSQSCSSCPPADKLLGDLAQKENIITLACHVTYWNHLHWKDTLSQEICTDRQRQFNHDQGSNRVYTPQMVVNGDNGFIGSRGRQAISRLNQTAALPLIPIQKIGSKIMYDLPSVTSENMYEIEMIITHKNHYESIHRGENKGKNITYTHPVKTIHRLKPWTGEQTNRTISAANLPKDGQLIILAREMIAGKIIAAGRLSL